MNGFGPNTTLDPLDLEVEPGLRVRDLATPADCASALMKLDMTMESIMAQIGRAEADPSLAAPGWRTRAQNAMRWKKRARRAVVALAATLTPHRPETRRPEAHDKRQAILDTVAAEVGAVEFDRFVALAKSRHPDLPWGAP